MAVSMLAYFFPTIPDPENNEIFNYVKMTLVSSIISLFIAIITIFVSVLKGPKCWKRIGPYIYFVLYVLQYILFPLTLISYFSYITFTNTSIGSIFMPWIIFTQVLCICKFLSYIITIHPRNINVIRTVI